VRVKKNMVELRRRGECIRIQIGFENAVDRKKF